MLKTPLRTGFENEDGGLCYEFVYDTDNEPHDLHALMDDVNTRALENERLKARISELKINVERAWDETDALKDEVADLQTRV